MKLKYINFVFFLLLFTKASSQKRYFTDHPIYVDLINQYIYVADRKDSSIRTNYGDLNVKYIKIFDITSKGGMKFIYIDSIKKSIIKGQYAAAQKLSQPEHFKRVGARVHGIGDPYYRPLRTGTWFYYDSLYNNLKNKTY